MFTKINAVKLLSAFFALILLLSSCGKAEGYRVVTDSSDINISGSDNGSQTDVSDTDWGDGSEAETEPETETDAEDTDYPSSSNDVIIEVQRPVAGAPGDSGQSSPSQSENAPVDTTEDEISEDPSVDEEESTDDMGDLPYADEAGVFVPYSVPMSIEDQKLVERIAARFNVHEELVFGVMWAESRYDRGAVGRNDRYLGVMQVSTSNLPVLEKYLGVTDLMNFEQNVTAGCYFLGHYADLYDHNMNIMLLYYHGGYKYANPMIQQGILEDRYVREVFAEMNRIIEARKQTAADMGVKLKGWLYEY